MKCGLKESRTSGVLVVTIVPLCSMRSRFNVDSISDNASSVGTPFDKLLPFR